MPYPRAPMDQMGPVLDATPEVQAVCSLHQIKHDAIHKLHLLHKEATVHHFHHFEEHEKDSHIANWT